MRVWPSVRADALAELEADREDVADDDPAEDDDRDEEHDGAEEQHESVAIGGDLDGLVEWRTVR